MEKSIKLRNIRTEIILLKTFCKSNRLVRSYILKKVNEEFFGSKIGKIVWKRVRALNISKKLPNKGAWEALINDPTLGENSIQDLLLQFEDVEIGKSKKFIDKLIDALDVLRQKRQAFNSIQQAYEDLSEADSEDDITSALAPLLSSAKKIADVTTGEWFFRMDTLKLLEYLKQYKAKEEGRLLKTLWYQFDALNAGFSVGSLVTIAATTSGGKSAIAALNLMINFSLQGMKTAVVSLEMPKAQLAERQASFVSGIPFSRIRSFKLTLEEEAHLDKTSALLENLVKAKGGEYWILNPPSKDISIQEALLLPYEKGARVILVDYINLLRRHAKQEMKDFLLDVSREAKVFAMQNDCIVILLAQLNAEERVKYSTAVEDNSDNVIVWSYPANNRPGYIEVKQTKARNQNPYHFYLVEDFQNMRIYDILDPIGLSIMLSRASGKQYASKTSEYFGMRRMIETQDISDLNSLGVKKHDFVNSINWEDLTTETVPAPNAPPVTTILDMAREMLHFIATYEPQIALKLLENIKKSDILLPFKDYIDDLDLPIDAKRTLGLLSDEEKIDDRKKRLIAKIQKDLLVASQGLYIEADKLADSDRANDIVSSREKIYDDTYEQIEARNDPEKPLRKRNKRKIIIDPSKNKSKWLNINKGYVKRKQMKVDSTPYRNTDGSPFDSLNDKNPKSHKKAIADYKKHWKNLEKDTPVSTDTIKEHMILHGGIGNISFLSSINGDYINKIEQSIFTVGEHLQRSYYRVNKKVQYGIAEELLTKKGKINWGKAYKNELELQSFVNNTLMDLGTINNEFVVDADSKKLPDVNSLVKDIGNKIQRLVRSAKATIALDTNEFITKINSNGSFIVKDDLKRRMAALKETSNIGRIELLLDEDDIMGSPWISLFKKPEYIGCITPNTLNIAEPWFFLNVISSNTLSKIITSEPFDKEKLIRSVVWAVVNPDYRENNQLLTNVKHSMHQLLGCINENSLSSIFIN